MQCEVSLPKQDSVDGRTLRCIWRVSMEVEAQKQYQIKDQLGPDSHDLAAYRRTLQQGEVMFAPWLSLPYCALRLRSLKSDALSLPFTTFTDQCHSIIQFSATPGSSLALERLYMVLPEGSSTCQCCLLFIAFRDVQTMDIEEGLKLQLRKNGNILKIYLEYFSYPWLWRSCLVFFHYSFICVVNSAGCINRGFVKD